MRFVHTGLLFLAGLIAVSCTGAEDDLEQSSSREPDVTTSTTIAPTTIAPTTTAPTTTAPSRPSTSSTLMDVGPVDPGAIVGNWATRFGNIEYFFIFGDDGTFRVVYFLESEFPFDFGTYEFDGHDLVLHSDEEVTGSPCGGTEAHYRVSWSTDQERFTLPEASGEDECARRRNELVRIEFTKVNAEPEAGDG